MNDPLNISVKLGGVDAARPLLPDGDYAFQITRAFVAPNKDETGNNLNLELALASPATSVDHREIKPGFKVFSNSTALQAKQDSTDPEAYVRSLCDVVDAIFGTNKDTRPDLTLTLVENMMGKMVLVTTQNEEFPKGSGNFSTKARRFKKYVG